MVTQPTPKHDFLRSLHELLKPAMYLEIGVQSGTSMAQVLPTTAAIGVDPEPWPDARRRLTNPGIQQIYPVTSDKFFAEATPSQLSLIDLAFIDGMHLIEHVLNDFINCEERAAPDGVIAVDDVLPFTTEMAVRTPLPGHWTGDVWKLWPILAKWRPDLEITMVDVAPTGLMVVQGLDPTNGPALLRAYYDQIVETWAVEFPLDRWVTDGSVRGRVGTFDPAGALQKIEEFRQKGH